MTKKRLSITIHSPPPLETVSTMAAKREKVTRDVEAFLANGGEITKVGEDFCNDSGSRAQAVQPSISSAYGIS